MALEDMPPIGTAAWAQWYNQQDPETQWNVQYTFANDLPGSMTGGGMAPEMNPTAFDFATMSTPLPEMSSKGKVLPVDVDTLKKQIGVIKAQDSQLMDPVTMLMSGAGSYDPSLFQSQMIGVGQPLQTPGHDLISGYSQGGGAEGYLAQQILKGKNPGEAFGQLMQVLTAPDTGDPNVDGQRDALRSTLTPRYDTNQIPGQQMKIDWTSPQSIATAYDISGLNKLSTDMYQKLLTDPTTGVRASDNQMYASVTEKKTPAQEYFDKAMLPYPTASYTDPSYLEPYISSVGGAAESDVQKWLTDREAATAAKDTAKTKADSYTSTLDTLQKAWDDAIKTQGVSPDTAGAPAPNLGQVPMLGPGSMSLGPSKVMPISGKSSPSAFAAPWIEVNPDGTIKISDQQYGPGDVIAKNPDGSIKRDANGAAIYAPGPTSAKELDKSKVTKMGPLEARVGFTTPTDSALGAGSTTGRRRMTKDDLTKIQSQQALARTALSDAVNRYSQANATPEAYVQRELAKQRMARVAAAGRTPLSDALAQRMLTARAQGVYG